MQKKVQLSSTCIFSFQIHHCASDNFTILFASNAKSFKHTYQPCQSKIYFKNCDLCEFFMLSRLLHNMAILQMVTKIETFSFNIFLHKPVPIVWIVCIPVSITFVWTDFWQSSFKNNLTMVILYKSLSHILLIE